MASNETIMNIEDIMKILPHRYPFLLVDRVIEKKGDRFFGGNKECYNE